MDFALLPPEINSALMYAGPGSGPMLGAAAAWDELSAEMYATASSYQSVITSLTAGPWIGPASAAMAAAATPYVAWLKVTALQAEHTADQAKAAALAYETAFAETVPPPVVAANRSLLMMLIATNFFGQNTPLIALTETQYADMWAQDTAAMQSYAASSAAATTLTPFAEPASITDSSGLPAQAAAVSQATGTAAGEVQSLVSSAQQALSAVPAALAGLATPAPAAAVSPFDIVTLLDFGAGLISGTLDGIVGTTALPYDIGGYHIGVHTDDIVSGWAGIESWPGSAPVPPTQFPVITNLGSPVSAGLGEAGSVGGLSVPPGWTTAAPGFRLAALTSPAASVGAAAEASAEGAGALFSQMAVAGMAGRAMAGTVGTSGSGGARTKERVGVAKRGTPVAAETSQESAKPPPALPGGPITSIAAELRELASLRDAGILTEQEFTEQKQRLLPQ
ncbi:PPE family protein, SVP subgroup [Mycobacterium sp. Z3061]|uniref:PPE family protein, SVP subgroup n=1 Tax=Mycobacterium sp. Z3061 TaxID=3073562 RepID=UPI002872F693|nr:PPE domain-containing protein [Mycobacterium sp. Z3061]